MAGRAAADLTQLSATEQLRLFAGGDLSPVEVLEAQIERTGATEPVVNAFSATHFDEALERARSAEARWGSEEARALEGITVAVKDEHDVAGWVTRNGCANFTDRRPDRNHPLIDRLLDAGAILHAQTRTPELSLLCTTWSDVGGITRNPLNSDVTPGGSSGGSAAALAAQTTTLATGSDMAGSIRVPASMCGIYGYKPPFAAVPPHPDDAGIFYASDGPMARSLDDLALMLEVLSDKPMPPNPQVRRVAVAPDLGYALDDEVDRCFGATLDRLADAGCELTEVALRFDPQRVAAELMTGLLASPLRDYLLEAAEGGLETMTPYARRYIDRARSAQPADARRSAAFAADVAARLDAVWGDGFDALVCPTVATTRVPADLDPFGPPLRIGGVDVDPELGWVLTPAFNLANRCGVLAAPIGTARNGAGIGIQIVVPAGGEASAFVVAGRAVRRERGAPS